MLRERFILTYAITVLGTAVIFGSIGLFALGVHFTVYVFELLAILVFFEPHRRTFSPRIHARDDRDPPWFSIHSCQWSNSDSYSSLKIANIRKIMRPSRMAELFGVELKPVSNSDSGLLFPRLQVEARIASSQIQAVLNAVQMSCPLAYWS